MKYLEFEEMLKLENKVININRAIISKEGDKFLGGCNLRNLKDAFLGKEIIFTKDNLTCNGAISGLGFQDGLPNMPGGFGNFLCKGKGDGFPLGERIKATPEIGEKMMLNQPKNVMKGNNAVIVKPFFQDEYSELVMLLVNCDQLAAMVHLFNYRKIDYDNVIMPMVSGCASLFRIPFKELEKSNPRAVIGNVDIFSRPHFDKDTYFFIVPRTDFDNMLSDADDSFLNAPIWKAIKKRL